MDLDPAIVAKLRERADRSRELAEHLASPAEVGGPRYSKLLREHGQLEAARELFERYLSLRSREAEARRILADAREDADLRQLAGEDLLAVEGEFAALEDEVKRELVTTEEDRRTRVILEIRAGTGGDEATLFARDLYRIYQRYCEHRGWRVEELELTPSEVGGFKEVIVGVSGPDCWRLLRFESGGHRVQRVPATETQGRIHTSAATVAVLPEAEEAEVVIHDNDLRIDTMRAGGPGGQSVNKTSSAVRITHLPTNTVVICQDEKSQHKNKARAMRILTSRLLEAEERRLHAERAANRKTQVGSGDRSERVRTYNYPQNRVTDHRLGENVSLEQVLSGKLDPILEGLAALEWEDRLAAL